MSKHSATANLTSKEIQHELWTRGQLSWLLHSSQQDVYAKLRGLPRNVRRAVVLISRRWGKSFLGCVMALEDCLLAPNRQVFICGPNLKHVTGIVVPIIRQLIQSAPEGLVKHTKTALRWQFANGSALILGAFDTALESFRGLFADAIYLEETGLSDPNEYDYTIKSVLFPTLAHSRGRITDLTTPSVVVEHPFHLETIPAARANDAFFLKTVYENPLLSDKSIEELKHESGGEGSIHWQREYLCQIVRDANIVVLPSFDMRHIVECKIPPYMNWQMTVDWGGVRDKTVALLSLFDIQRNKVLILDERHFDANTSTADITASIVAMEHEHGAYKIQRFADAPGQLLVDLHVAHKFDCALPAKTDWLASIQALDLAFYKDEIEVHPRCKFFISSARNGRFNTNRTDFERSHMHGHCDALACGQYLWRMTNRGNPYPHLHGYNPATQNISARMPTHALLKALQPTF